MTYSLSVALGLVTSAAVALLLPVILGVVLLRKTRVRTRVFFLGALTFVVSQLVLRLPWQIPLGLWMGKHLTTTAEKTAWLAFAALTAGLFEEVGRYVVMARLMKEDRGFQHGVVHGAGHGGVESFLLVGIGLAVNAALYFALYLGLPLHLPETATAALEKAFAAVTPAAAFAGGLERVFAVTEHLAMSAMVMQGFITGRRARWLAAAITFHTLADFFGVLGAKVLTPHGGPLFGELAIAVWAMAAAFMLWQLGKGPRAAAGDHVRKIDAVSARFPREPA